MNRFSAINRWQHLQLNYYQLPSDLAAEQAYNLFETTPRIPSICRTLAGPSGLFIGKSMKSMTYCLLNLLFIGT